ncbi:lysylphosphatidylglycerol synthase domain-containing protein [Devosia sp. CAU 1758]
MLLLAIMAVSAGWTGIVAALSRSQPAWLVTAIILSAGVFPLWSWQWRVLIAGSPAPGHKAMLAVVSANSIVSSFLAPGAGAALAALMLSEKGVRAPSIAALLLVDQLMTGASKLLVLVLALLSAPLPSALAAGGPVIGITMALLLALLAALVRLGPRQWPSTRLAWPPLALVSTFLGAVARALAAIGDSRTIALVAGLALGKKVLEWTMITAVQLSCGMGWAPELALFVLAAAGVSTMLPVIGGVGLLAAGTAGAYLVLGIPAPTAIAVGILISIVDLPAAIAYFTWGHVRRLDYKNFRP